MQVLNIFHVLIAIALVAIVLIQRGQGATAGAAFGSGASGTVFGARGAGNFLSRSTWVLAALFCAISLTMAVLISRSGPTETDLGVIGAAQQAAPSADTVNVTEQTVGAPESTSSDVPQFDPSSGAALDAPDGGARVTDDIPSLDGVEQRMDETRAGDAQESSESANDDS
ncbi:MAG: preprotein translocase subunit SecG [Xanthomonadales bacterium]|nr:preprotein translocase subunit SecG [Xanthomonadales bacterium]